MNCRDTAEMFAVLTRPETQGRSELHVGTRMTRRGRDKAIVAGKVTSTSPKTWIPPARTPPQPSGVTRLNRASIIGAVNTSLARLQTDCIDLIELHWPERYIGTLFGACRYERKKEQTDVVSFEEQIDAPQALLKEGKIRAWGLSNETTYGPCMFWEAARRMGTTLICLLVGHPAAYLIHRASPFWRAVLLGAVLFSYAVGTMPRVGRQLVPAAHSLGASSWVAFWRVFLPLTRPGIWAGGMMVGVHGLGFFVVPAVLGGASETTAVMAMRDLALTRGIWGLASALAVLVIVLSLAGAHGYVRATGLAHAHE